MVSMTGAECVIVGTKATARIVMCRHTSLVLTISTITAPGVWFHRMVPFGFQQLHRVGPPTITVIGFGLNPGVGLGLMMRLGALRLATTDDGFATATIGAGLPVQ